MNVREQHRDGAPRIEGNIQAEGVIKNSRATLNRNLYVVCFNCGEMGHLSSSCNRPKVCFNCRLTDHVVEQCPEWLKPPMAAQYYGSACVGLGFYHIDVGARDNRFSHWNGMDNFGVLSIVEGEMDEAGILENLRELFDKDWNWQLKKTDDTSYIVRFPPSRKVENFVIGKASLFQLNRPKVVASLSVWNGDVEPVGNLIEVWV